MTPSKLRWIDPDDLIASHSRLTVGRLGHTAIYRMDVLAPKLVGLSPTRLGILSIIADREGDITISIASCGREFSE